MNIHIIKEADGNGITAVYVSNGGLSPYNLERAIEKAIDAAMEAEDLDTFAFVDRYLAENYDNVFRVDHADVESNHSHAFMTSEF